MVGVAIRWGRGGAPPPFAGSDGGDRPSRGTRMLRRRDLDRDFLSSTKKFPPVNKQGSVEAADRCQSLEKKPRSPQFAASTVGASAVDFERLARRGQAHTTCFHQSGSPLHLSALMMGGFNFEDHGSQHLVGNFDLRLPQVKLDHDGHAVTPQNFLDSNSSDFSGAPLSTGDGEDALDLSEFKSDMLLNYINNMLMEEDMDDKIYVHEGASALQAAEKSFSDVLNEWKLPSPDHPPLYSDSLESPDDSGEVHLSNSKETNGGSGTIDDNNFHDSGESSSFQVNTLPGDSTSQSLFDSFSVNGNLSWSGEQNLGSERIPDLFLESLPVWQFNRGLEEANKFLPNSNKLVIDVESSAPLPPVKEGTKFVKVKEEEEFFSHDGSKVRKHGYNEHFDSEDGRGTKQTAVYFESTIPTEDFDKALLCDGAKKCCEDIDKLRQALENERSKNAENDVRKGSSNGRTKGRKHTKKEVVDLRTLLVHCAQSIASDDYRSAGELLKQIRQHSSPQGDGSQRLAHCFANGLEARLAGTVSHVYHSFMQKQTTAANILKAYQVYMAACPFKKITYFFSNKTILNVSRKTTRLHIIDFGTSFGFQWPCFLQQLAAMNSGPIKLVLTAVDEPLPGFRPTQRIDETGHRLEEYAKRFKIDFEFNSIASKIENIQVEDMKIRKDEVVVVNYLYGLGTLADETVMVDSPRDIILSKIRKMNPDVFIHALVNGSYSSPFFVTRFREALFHFSALFDMLDCTVPREIVERSCFERELFGREALNVIACEGFERVQRPETYKQWQVRNQRAGFTQLPLNEDIVKYVKNNIKCSYNKDFIIDDDNKWLLQGWKGRILYAISTWRPTASTL